MLLLWLKSSLKGVHHAIKKKYGELNFIHASSTNFKNKIN